MENENVNEELSEKTLKKVEEEKVSDTVIQITLSENGEVSLGINAPEGSDLKIVEILGAIEVAKDDLISSTRQPREAAGPQMSSEEEILEMTKEVEITLTQDDFDMPGAKESLEEAGKKIGDVITTSVMGARVRDLAIAANKQRMAEEAELTEEDKIAAAGAPMSVVVDEDGKEEVEETPNTDPVKGDK